MKKVFVFLIIVILLFPFILNTIQPVELKEDERMEAIPPGNIE